MTPERWQRISAVCHDALMCPEAERPDFLDRECDADLRSDVEELLQQDALAEDERFLTRFSSRDPASSNGAAVRPEALPRLPRRLGPYEIREQIGAGGMGSVFRAVRVDDYRQEVAIKFLKQGLESNDAVRRFHMERQVLASLNHPNIARLLDGGASEGLPYLVMEYIAGQSLDHYCDRNELPLEDRLKLFVSICRAVDYAHQRMIVHRDLKPSNILVAEDGTPKITDFGLAKQATSPEKTVVDSPTNTGAVFGTPNYMAPEQASGQAKLATPATDVYSLGAVLYELLTGRPPHRGESPVKTILLVLHEEPVPPRRLHPGLPRDVETICLKCLRKETSARYASAAAIADDIERFYSGRPIHARPVGPVSRSVRWCRRRPVVAGLLALLFVVFAGALTGIISLWVLAERRAVALERQKDELERQKQVAARQRDQARLAVDDMYTNVADGWLAAEPQMQELQYKFLSKALAYYQTLAAEDEIDPTIRHKTAEAYYRIGIIQSKLGAEPSQTLESFQRAISHWEQLTAEFPKDPKYPLALFHSYKMLQTTLPDAARQTTYYAELLVDRFPEEPKHWDILANHCSTLGHLATGRGEVEDAERYFKRGLEVAETVSANHPDRPFFKKNIGTNSRGLGSLYYAVDRSAEAETYLRRAVRVAMELTENPGTEFSRADAKNGLRLELAQYRGNLASALTQLEKFSEAEDLLRQALDAITILARDHPKLYGYSFQLACTQIQLGELYLTAKRPAEARDYYVRSRKTLEEMLEKFPGVAYATKSHVSNLLCTCPIPELRDEKRAVELARDVMVHSGRNPGSCRGLGVALYRAGNWTESIAELEDARDGSAYADVESGLYLAMAYHKLGDKDKARACFDAAVRRMTIPHKKSLGLLRDEAARLLE
jgi:tetratricopeptide (TPR) repeat protein